MALRNIRIMGDKVLEKKCRPVDEITPKIRNLISDMFETMYERSGVGLAAPQVGILKRIVVVDIGEATAQEGTNPADNRNPIVMINPSIVYTSGEQVGDEGCLSLPGKSGQVTRPAFIKAEALDENMKPYSIEAEGLLARAICHEVDHLNGILYTSLVEGELVDVQVEESYD